MRKISVLTAAVAMTVSSLCADIQIGKGLSVGGFIDMAYTNVSTDDKTVANADTDASGFNVTTAEIDFMMDFSKGLTARVDLEGTVSSDSAAAANGDIDIEQARIDYAFGQSTLTLGKFDTFIGLEGLEAPDLYQFSNSLTFKLEPTQHEGVAYAFDGGMWNMAFALVNGIGSDNGNANAVVAGTDKTSLAYAFHVGLKPTEALSLNVNYATGDDEATTGLGALAAGAADTDIWTIDASYSNHGWTVGAEYVNVSEENGAAKVDTDAWMLMANYMFTEQFGLTARYSVSDAEDNAAVKTKSEKNELAIAASYAVTPNWSALVEYQQMETKNTSDVDTIALETILTF